MTFEELEDNQLIKDDFLWRYINIHKFIHLIVKRKLVLMRCDQFDDPFEGISFKLLAQRMVAHKMPSAGKFNPTTPYAVKEKALQWKLCQLYKLQAPEKSTIELK